MSKTGKNPNDSLFAKGNASAVAAMLADDLIGDDRLVPKPEQKAERGGRPRRPKPVQANIKMPQQLSMALHLASLKQGRTMSQIVCDAVKEKLPDEVAEARTILAMREKAEGKRI